MMRGGPEPSHQGGRIRSRETYGSSRAHLNRRVRSRAIGHVAVPEPTVAKR
jgi:hypothetical protein